MPSANEALARCRSWCRKRRYSAEVLKRPSGAHGAVDQLGQIMRHLDVGGQPEEHVNVVAVRVLLAPDPAIAEPRDRPDAVVDRNALLAMGLVDLTVAGRCLELDVRQRQVVAIEQFRDLGGGGQRLVLGAAIGNGLGAQRLNAGLQLVERG
jgi:hypothetical protein